MGGASSSRRFLPPSANKTHVAVGGGGAGSSRARPERVAVDGWYFTRGWIGAIEGKRAFPEEAGESDTYKGMSHDTVA